MNPMEFTLNPHTNFLTTVNVKPRDLFRIEDTWFLANKDDKDYFDDFHGLNAIELPCCGYRAFDEVAVDEIVTPKGVSFE